MFSFIFYFKTPHGVTKWTLGDNFITRYNCSYLFENKNNERMKNSIVLSSFAALERLDADWRFQKKYSRDKIAYDWRTAKKRENS